MEIELWEQNPDALDGVNDDEEGVGNTGTAGAQTMANEVA